MTIKDLTMKFFDIEKSNGLNDLSFNNVKFWPYLRYLIYQQLRDAYLNIKFLTFSYGDERRKIKGLKNRYHIKKLIRNNDIIVLNHPRRVNINGVYTNVHSDLICQYLSKFYKLLLIEEPFYIEKKSVTPTHLNPVAYNNITYTDCVEQFVAKKISRALRNKKCMNEIHNCLDNIIQIFKNSFSKIREQELFDNLSKRLLYVKYARKVFYKLYKSSKAKAILMFYSFSQTKLITCDVCKELQIPVIELQHGIQTELDPLFFQVCDKEKTYPCLPDKIFAFGKGSIVPTYYPNNLTKNIIPTGNPHLEKRVNDLKSAPLSNKKNILFISQTTIGNKLCKIAQQLALLLEKKPEYHIFYKLHPYELNNKYPELLNLKNLTVIDNIENDSCYYQNQSFCQVGIYSTALFEGLKFNLPFFVVDGIFGSNLNNELISKLSCAKKVTTAKEIYDYITLNKITKPTEEDINFIWQPNALENMKNELEKIINE